MSLGKWLRGVVQVAKVLNLDQLLKGVLHSLIDKVFASNIENAQKVAVQLKQDRQDWQETKELLDE